MKLKFTVVLGIIFLAVHAYAADPSILKTPKDRVDYAIGVDVARNMTKMGVEVNVDLVLKGMRDGFSGKNVLMSDGEIRQVISDYQTEMKVKMAERSRAAGAGNKKAGEAFRTENQARPGVITLPSGLQYTVIKAAEGPKPVEEDTVECNYVGKFVDGTVFDSSREQPSTFKISQGIIKGFKEALLLMPLGSKWQLVIPPELAYGEKGTPPRIGPNATLVFEIELISIKKN